MTTNIVSLDEFFFTEVNDGYPADIECLACNYRGTITLDDTYFHTTKEYSNPNYNLIIEEHRHLRRWLYVNPTAVKFINDIVSQLCCPCCDKDSVSITPDSTYNMMRILESLQCHTV